jgi:hypothetical protein
MIVKTTKNGKYQKRCSTLLKYSPVTLVIMGCLVAFATFHAGTISNDREGEMTKSQANVRAKAPSFRSGPFQMPIKGQGFEIFQPLYDMDNNKKDEAFIASPEVFIQIFEKRISWVDYLLDGKKTPELKKLTTREHATFMFLEMMKSFVSGVVFNDAEMSIAGSSSRALPFSMDSRKMGQDFTYAGDTMTGWKRLDNVRLLIQDVIRNNIEGDYIETGVWRGGSSIFAKATIKVLEPGSKRVSYVCDSFKGLPPGEKNLDKGDKNWDNWPYLEIPSDVVANNFIKYGMLDSNVVFAKGFFNETMPPLSKKINKLSVMRLDVSLLLMIVLCVAKKETCFNELLFYDPLYYIPFSHLNNLQ